MPWKKEKGETEKTEKFSERKSKFILTWAQTFSIIDKSAIGPILPKLRDIAMNREIAQAF